MTPKQKDQAWVESQRAANAKAATRHRDAITGQYVDEDHVKANPDTTVTETNRIPYNPLVAIRLVANEHGLIAGPGAQGEMKVEWTRSPCSPASRRWSRSCWR